MTVVERALIFGCGPGADIVISDEYVSAKHCRVQQDSQGRYWAGDLGSTNGTWLHRLGEQPRRINQPVQLEPGDRIVIGHTMLPWEVPA